MEESRSMDFRSGDGNDIERQELFTGKYRKSGRNKKKAESQFNFNAKPVKIEDFISSIAPVEPDRIDISVEPNLEDKSPNKYEKVNLFPQNSVELSLEVLNFSEVVCDLVDVQKEFNCKNLDLETIDENFFQIKETINNNKLEFAGKEFKQQRLKTPLLTAKRLKVKALQLFSFSENYSKHFTIDPGELRSLNIDMMFDESSESAAMINKIGELNMMDVKSRFTIGSYINTLLNLREDSNFYKIVGYSILLTKIRSWHLNNYDEKLSDYYPQLKNSLFKETRTRDLFEYFGLMLFGRHHCLNFQLNYLHVIKNYVHKPKPTTSSELFKYLDKHSRKDTFTGYRKD